MLKKKSNILIFKAHTLNKGGWFFFFWLSHMSSFLPPWRTILRFFFFPRDFCPEKKKPSTKFDLNPKIRKNPFPFGIKSRLFTPRFFFFMPNPEGKKNRKIISFLPIFSDDRQFCVWVPKNKKAIPLWYQCQAGGVSNRHLGLCSQDSLKVIL